MNIVDCKLIATVGLPRSGKTTWARQQGYPIVCPDSIRLALHSQRFETRAEPMVWAMATIMVRALFLAGHSVVILDSTCTTEARREPWKTDEWETWWKIIPTPAVNCIERAVVDGDIEIIPVIERMAAKLEFPTTDLWTLS